ncbi:MAG: hypothetical protein AAF191_12650 [Verrucomicrobiota bacterium]
MTIDISYRDPLTGSQATMAEADFLERSSKWLAAESWPVLLVGQEAETTTKFLENRLVPTWSKEEVPPVVAHFTPKHLQGPMAALEEAVLALFPDSIGRSSDWGHLQTAVLRKDLSGVVRSILLIEDFGYVLGAEKAVQTLFCEALLRLARKDGIGVAVAFHEEQRTACSSLPGFCHGREPLELVRLGHRKEQLEEEKPLIIWGEQQEADEPESEETFEERIDVQRGGEPPKENGRVDWRLAVSMVGLGLLAVLWMIVMKPYVPHSVEASFEEPVSVAEHH